MLGNISPLRVVWAIITPTEVVARAEGVAHEHWIPRIVRKALHVAVGDVVDASIEAERIRRVGWIVLNVDVVVDAAQEPDRILAQKASDLRVVVSCSVVVKARFSIPFTPREAYPAVPDPCRRFPQGSYWRVRVSVADASVVCRILPRWSAR
jgi:hypothetical protein